MASKWLEVAWRRWAWSSSESLQRQRRQGHGGRRADQGPTLDEAGVSSK